MNALLEVENLRKLYPIGGGSILPAVFGGRKEPDYLHAVDDISFTIGEGESVGLVGESGCGKSTLVRLISRLIDPTSGGIRLAGQEIGAVPADRFGRRPERGQLQVVFQDPHDSLNPRFTAFRCIADPLLRLGGYRGGEKLQARVKELARLVGLPLDLLQRLPHQLSGGQKARVNIARAIALNPRLLILDEPTAALDVSVQAVILHLLAELKERLSMSYLFVSHDLNVVRLLCDRVMVMYLGKLVEVGSSEQLFRQPAHPYTRALISAIPHADADATRTRLSGEPGTPVNPDPSRCRFAGRCGQRVDACVSAMPTLREIETGHRVACCQADGPAADSQPSLAAQRAAG